MKKMLQTNMRECLFSKLLIVGRNKTDGANKQQILHTLYVGESNFIIPEKLKRTYRQLNMIFNFSYKITE